MLWYAHHSRYEGLAVLCLGNQVPITSGGTKCLSMPLSRGVSVGSRDTSSAWVLRDEVSGQNGASLIGVEATPCELNSFFE